MQYIFFYRRYLFNAYRRAGFFKIEISALRPENVQKKLKKETTIFLFDIIITYVRFAYLSILILINNHY